jgi:protein SCO1/2
LIGLMLACAAPLEDFGAVPPFLLTDQSGQTVSRDVLLGRVWVADFFFTSCPDVCPGLSARMAELQGKWDDVDLVSFSVDPTTDTAPVLAAYAARFGADGRRWHLLTGPTEAIRATVVDGFRQTMQGAGTDILHGSRFVVVDEAGHIRGFPDPKVPGEVEAVVGRLR